MSPRTLTRALGAALGLAAALVAVFLLWPVQLGGWTAYAVVDGTSMEPGLATDDLVLTRARGGYAVGDAVLYESDLLDANVLHRIVAEDAGRFAFRGDNRTENDPEALTEAAIVGSVWLTIPGAGRALRWLGEPLNLAIVSFVIVLLLLAGGREVSRRRRRGVDPVPLAAEPQGREGGLLPPSAARALLVAGAIALVAFGMLALAAWTQPGSTTRTVVGGYAHTGSFTYAARARRGAAYPDGKVTTGQPVFVRLSRTVDVSFDYRFVSDRPASIRGGVALDAVLSDGAGWERTVPLVAEGPFTGPSARADGVLDLRRLLGIVSRVQTSTGASLSQVTVTVVPRLAVAGYAGDAALDEAFAPTLPFTLDTVALRLAEPQSGTPTGEPSEPGAVAASPLTPRTEGSTIVTEPAVLSLGPLVTLEVDRARSLAAVGILAALAALMLGAALLLRRPGGSEADRIEARHGSRVVRARATIPEGRWVTELQDVDALIRLAEAYDRVVLRVVEPDGGDAFLVDDGIALYRYRTDRVGALGTPRPLPAHGR